MGRSDDGLCREGMKLAEMSKSAMVWYGSHHVWGEFRGKVAPFVETTRWILGAKRERMHKIAKWIF